MARSILLNAIGPQSTLQSSFASRNNARTRSTICRSDALAVFVCMAGPGAGTPGEIAGGARPKPPAEFGSLFRAHGASPRPPARGGEFARPTASVIVEPLPGGTHGNDGLRPRRNH